MHSAIPGQLRADRIAALDLCPTHPTPSLGACAAVVHKLNLPQRARKAQRLDKKLIFLCVLCVLCGKTSSFAAMNRATDKVRVIDHPLVAAGLSILRAKQTTPEIFRRHLQDISVLLYHEASRSWGTRSIEVETPLAPCAGAVLAKPIVLVP